MTGRALQVYETHLAALGERDLDAVVAGYHPDAVLASNAGIGRGREYIREIFAQYFAADSDIRPQTQVVEQDDVVFVTWTAAAGGQRMTGSDTFVVRDSLIAVHTGFIGVADGPV